MMCTPKRKGEESVPKHDKIMSQKWRKLCGTIYEAKQSSPATRHGGAWGEKIIAPTHSWPRHWMGVWVVSVTPRPRFAPGKGPPVPIVQEAGWAPEPVWTQTLEEKSFAPAGDRTSIARSSSP
jgi:hypothetical protein